LDQRDISAIVETVVARLKAEGKVPGGQAASSSASGVFGRIEDALAAARAAQPVWAATSRETKTKVIDALRAVMHAHAEEFARREWEETGLGRLADKIVKVHNAASATPGLEDLESRTWTGTKGLVVEDYAPYGIVAAVTPSTHPVPVLFNSLAIIIAPGNAVVFNVHPAAKNVSAYALGLFNKAIRENGGPANLATMAAEPTIESANTLFRDKSVRLIGATGGPGLVKAAFSAGKKVIAAGPGNPPVLVDQTADLDRAARSIIDGASFDNNILCIAEKEAFVVDAVYNRFMDAMARAGAVRLTRDQVKALAAKAFPENEKGEVTTSREFVGKNASVLARAAGLSIGDEVRLLFGEADFDCLFVQEEQMMPYLPVVRVKDVEEGIAMAKKAEHRYGHTAMIHSNNLETITRFGRTMNTSITVVNGSSLAGLGGMAGEGTFSHTVSSPTGEGVCTPRHFARIRRLVFSGTLDFV
jgi:acyl-CoA reductase-like NAD-dependent aldehyde dehydrogenase